jgi:hypothetical protein
MTYKLPEPVGLGPLGGWRYSEDQINEAYAQGRADERAEIQAAVKALSEATLKAQASEAELHKGWPNHER